MSRNRPPPPGSRTRRSDNPQLNSKYSGWKGAEGEQVAVAENRLIIGAAAAAVWKKEPTSSSDSFRGGHRPKSSRMITIGDEKRRKEEDEEQQQEYDHNDETVCDICFKNDEEDLILLCDKPGCQNEVHMFCLKPPLYQIPDGDWICPTCDQVGSSANLAIYLQEYDRLRSRSGNRFSDAESYKKWLCWVQQKYFILSGVLSRSEILPENFVESEFDSYNDDLIGKLVQIYSSYESRYHTGRITACRKDDILRRSEHLIHFKSGANGRNSPYLHWIALDEQRCIIARKIVFGRHRPGQPWMLGFEALRSGFEIFEQMHLYPKNDLGGRRLFFPFGGMESGLCSLRVNLATLVAVDDFDSIFMENQTEEGISGLNVLRALATAELEEQHAVRAAAREDSGLSSIEPFNVLLDGLTTSQLRSFASSCGKLSPQVPSASLIRTTPRTFSYYDRQADYMTKDSASRSARASDNLGASITTHPRYLSRLIISDIDKSATNEISRSLDSAPSEYAANISINATRGRKRKSSDPSVDGTAADDLGLFTSVDADTATALDDSLVSKELIALDRLHLVNEANLSLPKTDTHNPLQSLTTDKIALAHPLKHHGGIDNVAFYSFVSGSSNSLLPTSISSTSYNAHKQNPGLVGNLRIMKAPSFTEQASAFYSISESKPVSIDIRKKMKLSEAVASAKRLKSSAPQLAQSYMQHSFDPYIPDLSNYDDVVSYVDTVDEGRQVPFANTSSSAQYAGEENQVSTMADRDEGLNRERVFVREKIREAYSRLVNPLSRDDLLNICASVEEDLLFTVAQSRFDYLKAGVLLEKKLLAVSLPLPLPGGLKDHGNHSRHFDSLLAVAVQQQQQRQELPHSRSTAREVSEPFAFSRNTISTPASLSVPIRPFSGAFDARTVVPSPFPQFAQLQKLKQLQRLQQQNHPKQPQRQQRRQQQLRRNPVGDTTVRISGSEASIRGVQGISYELQQMPTEYSGSATSYHRPEMPATFPQGRFAGPPTNAAAQQHSFRRGVSVPGAAENERGSYLSQYQQPGYVTMDQIAPAAYYSTGYGPYTSIAGVGDYHPVSYSSVAPHNGVDPIYLSQYPSSHGSAGGPSYYATQRYAEPYVFSNEPSSLYYMHGPSPHALAHPTTGQSQQQGRGGQASRAAQRSSSSSSPAGAPHILASPEYISMQSVHPLHLGGGGAGMYAGATGNPRGSGDEHRARVIGAEGTSMIHPQHGQQHRGQYYYAAPPGYYPAYQYGYYG